MGKVLQEVVDKIESHNWRSQVKVIICKVRNYQVFSSKQTSSLIRYKRIKSVLKGIIRMSKNRETRIFNRRNFKFSKIYPEKLKLKKPKDNHRNNNKPLKQNNLLKKET